MNDIVSVSPPGRSLLPPLPANFDVKDMKIVGDCLAGKVPFPGAPTDITSYENAQLWRAQLSVPGWVSAMCKKVTPWGVIPVITITLGILGAILTIIMTYATPYCVAATPVVALAAGAVGYFSSVRMVQRDQPRIPVVALLKELRWDIDFNHIMCDLKKSNTELPHILLQVHYLLFDSYKNSHWIINSVGMSDCLDMIRLTDRLKKAKIAKAKHVELAGETEELLARVFEACGGIHPAEVVRV